MTPPKLTTEEKRAAAIARSELGPLAFAALESPGGEQVLADRIQEIDWFDVRVVPLMWPATKVPSHGFRSKAQRDRARQDRELSKAGFAQWFYGFLSEPSHGWARAVAAVCLFGGWIGGKRKAMWPMMRRCQKGWYTHTFNGIPFPSLERVVISESND